MKNKKNTEASNLKKQLVNAVGFKTRRLKSKKESREAGTASALALFGMVGWSIVVPLILFIVIGQFVIRKFELDSSVLLNFIFLGFAIGIYNTVKEFKKALNKNLKSKREGK